MQRPSTITTALLASGLAVLLTACGSSEAPDAGGTGQAATDAASDGQTSGDGPTVELQDFEIAAPASAAAGTTFTVTNTGESVHNWTADDGTFETDDLQAGQTATVTIDEPGTYAYLCTIHPDIMTGEITITES